MPFRIAGFVPFGTPIVVNMLVAKTPTAHVIAQALNQSHNAAVNWCNRNASGTFDSAGFFLGFAGAVTSASGIVLGLNHLASSLSHQKPWLGRFLPFPAVASANIVNLLCMRSRELSEGIDVLDNRGERVGTSKVAAAQAIRDTALTRVVLPMPNLILAPVLISLLERTSFVRSYPKVFLPAQVAVVSLCFGFGLPFSLSLFEQEGEVAADMLEPHLQQAARDRGLAALRYNKGL